MGLNKPGGGTLPTNTRHNTLINRTDADAHPMSAITGLVADLTAKATAISNATTTANSAVTTAGTANTNATEAETKADDALLKIGTLANLQTSNKTDLVGALNENFTNASNGKTAIASAVNGKGGTANAGMTFPQLADAVTAIPNISEATGNAVAGDVLAGKTFSNDVGNGIVGAMVNQSGVTVSALSTNATMNGVEAVAPAGFYDGVASKVKILDNDFIASNIKSGVNLFGLTGSLIQGREFASGTIQYNSLPYGYNNLQTVSSLAFTPRLVVLFTADTTGQQANGNYLIKEMDQLASGATVNGQVSGAVPDSANIKCFMNNITGNSFNYYVANTSSPQQTLSFKLGWLAIR